MRGKVAFTFVLLVVIIAAIVIGVSYSFNNVQGFRELFFASTPETLGSVGPEAEETLAKRSEFTARVSAGLGNRFQNGTHFFIHGSCSFV